MTNKLTDEQRLTKRLGDYVYFTKGAYSETVPMECTSQDVRVILQRLAEYEDIGMNPDDIKQLLSSDQAWKEEADKFKRLYVNTNMELDTSHIQLNQAIEVLKWYANEKNWFADPHDSSSVMTFDRGKLAVEFLSSLSKEEAT